MNDGGLSAIFLKNLPVLVVVLPLLLAVVAAVIPSPRAAWGISVVGIGGSFLAAIYCNQSPDLWAGLPITLAIGSRHGASNLWLTRPPA